MLDWNPVHRMGRGGRAHNNCKADACLPALECMEEIGRQVRYIPTAEQRCIWACRQTVPYTETGNSDGGKSPVLFESRRWDQGKPRRAERIGIGRDRRDETMRGTTRG